MSQMFTKHRAKALVARHKLPGEVIAELERVAHLYKQESAKPKIINRPEARTKLLNLSDEVGQLTSKLEAARNAVQWIPEPEHGPTGKPFELGWYAHFIWELKWLEKYLETSGESLSEREKKQPDYAYRRLVLRLMDLFERSTNTRAKAPTMKDGNYKGGFYEFLKDVLGILKLDKEPNALVQDIKRINRMRRENAPRAS